MPHRVFRFDDESFLLRIRHVLAERAGSRESEPTRASAHTQPSEAPSVEHLQLMIETAFLASCGLEEGRHSRFQIEYLSPDESGDVFVLREPQPFDVAHLLKLAPGLEEVGLYVGVAPSADGRLEIWGIGAKRSGSCGIRAFEPGRVAVQSYGATMGVVWSDHCRIVDYDWVERILIRAVGPRCPGPEILPEEEHVVDVLLMAGRAMRAHGRGGTLLFVPASSRDGWTASLTTPMPFEARSHFTTVQAGLRELYANGKPRGSETRKTGLLDEAYRLLGRLTAIDGATVVAWDFRVLAFGVKIKPVSARSTVEQVFVGEPFEGTSAEARPVASLFWGTRHASAAQFVYDQHDSVALVCSQDGEVSFFAWDDERSEVLVLRHLDALYNKPYK